MSVVNPSTVIESQCAQQGGCIYAYSPHTAYFSTQDPKGLFVRESTTSPDQAVASSLDQAKMQGDHEALSQIIKQWNDSRLDLFALSLPNENLEFYGIMRFYYQSQENNSDQKVSTKCIRVTSIANTQDVIQTLIEKFRPDMKMLEVTEYNLYEIHESGERSLGPDEKPLLVQLNWHKDDREGRFLLRRIDEVSQIGAMMSTAAAAGDSLFVFKKGKTTSKSKMSKKEKKALKKQEKQIKEANKSRNVESTVAEKLYSEFPETRFTRSISNPEAVMRRRRQQKLENKLEELRSRDGKPDTGGTLKIYGEALCKEVPYKTLLLSVHDTAAFVVEEMLEKYNMDRKEAPSFCLVQVTTATPSSRKNNRKMPKEPREYYLDDEECPLEILMNRQSSAGSSLSESVMFHIRPRPVEFLPIKQQNPSTNEIALESEYATIDKLPYLIEMNQDGSDVNPMQGRRPLKFCLQPFVTFVGSDPTIQSAQGLLLSSAPFVLPYHCIISNTDGVITLSPSHHEAETVVNNVRIFQTTVLHPGSIVRFGRNQCFRFVNPLLQEKLSHLKSSATELDPTYSPLYATGRIPLSFRRMEEQTWLQHYGKGHDLTLPAILEFREETEKTFFHEIIKAGQPDRVQFKLAPAYTLYMAARFQASTHYRSEIMPEERAVRLSEMLNYVAVDILRTVQVHQNNANYLAFWMANSAEILHFLKSDRNITLFSHQAQDLLADAVYLSFKQLVRCLRADLELAIPALLFDGEDDVHDDENISATTRGVLKVMQSVMSLLRNCRVNAAFIIQLFSQLFHLINAWIFNQIIAQTPQNRSTNFCTRKYGILLKKRLSRIENWAEKQGLELAANFHLARVVQAAHLLHARKDTVEDIITATSTSYKLNSLQLKAMLRKYETAPDEKPMSRQMIDAIVRVAEKTVDEISNAEGLEVQLEEDYELQLPFILPKDGYSCDLVQGIPGGLTEFLMPLQQAGFCVMTPQPTSSGFWTIYMENILMAAPALAPRSSFDTSFTNASMATTHPRREPEVETIQILKSNKGMGISIVAAKALGKNRLGIYIKSVVEGGAAWRDRRLKPGDQLLKVDGQSLVGVAQEQAAEIMMQTGQVVELEVAREAAFFHGLEALLSQPSPEMSLSNNVDPPYPIILAGRRRLSDSDFSCAKTPKSFQNRNDHTCQNLRRGTAPLSGSHLYRYACRSFMPAKANVASRSMFMENLPINNGFQRTPSLRGSLLFDIKRKGFISGSQADHQKFCQNIRPNGRSQYFQHPVLSHHQGYYSSSFFDGSQSYSQQNFDSHLERLRPAVPESSGSILPYYESGKALKHFSTETKALVPSNNGNENRVILRNQSTFKKTERPSSNEGVSIQLEKLRLLVEKEYHRRLEMHQKQFGEDHTKKLQDKEKKLTGVNLIRTAEDRITKLESIQRKQHELEEIQREEEFILNEARNRRSRIFSNSPPPVPLLPFPDESSAFASQRVDLSTNIRTLMPIKKVSFRNYSDDTMDTFDSDMNNFVDKKLNGQQRDAESSYDSEYFQSTVPSNSFDSNASALFVVEEVYKDPRRKQPQESDQGKESFAAHQTDDAKLSFREKVMLVGEAAAETQLNVHSRNLKPNEMLKGEERQATKFQSYQIARVQTYATL